MITLKKPTKKHNPAILRFKRIARAVGVTWREVQDERDRLLGIERESRQSGDDARQIAWTAHNRLNGWSASHDAFWRNGMARQYARRIAKGADYTSIPRYDEIASAVREQVPEHAHTTTGELFETLLDDYLPLEPITAHYGTALAGLCWAALSTESAPF